MLGVNSSAKFIARVCEKHSMPMVLNDFSKRRILFYHEKGYRLHRIALFIARYGETGTCAFIMEHTTSLGNLLDPGVYTETLKPQNLSPWL